MFNDFNGKKTLFLWSFSIAMLNYQRVNVPLYPHYSFPIHPILHEIPMEYSEKNPMICHICGFFSHVQCLKTSPNNAERSHLAKTPMTSKTTVASDAIPTWENTKKQVEGQEKIVE